MMDAGVPFVLMLVLALVGLLVIGGIVLLVLLLANEKTRVAGIVLLLIMLLGVPIVGVAAVAFWCVGSRSAPVGPPPRVDSARFDPQPAMEPPLIKLEPAAPEPAQGGDPTDRPNATPDAEEPAPDPEAPAPNAGAGPEQAPPDQPPRQEAN